MATGDDDGVEEALRAPTSPVLPMTSLRRSRGNSTLGLPPGLNQMAHSLDSGSRGRTRRRRATDFMCLRPLRRGGSRICGVLREEEELRAAFNDCDKDNNKQVDECSAGMRVRYV